MYGIDTNTHENRFLSRFGAAGLSVGDRVRDAITGDHLGTVARLLNRSAESVQVLTATGSVRTLRGSQVELET